MARAAANPAAKNYGTNVVGIVAEQDDYFTKREIPAAPTDSEITDNGGYPNLIEFRAPYTLTPIKQFYPVERLKGNPTPDPSIPGMQMGGGGLNFYLDPTLALFWLKHLLQATTVDSTALGTVPVNGTTLLDTDGKLKVDPKTFLQDATNYGVGTNNKFQIAAPIEQMTACRLGIGFTPSGSTDTVAVSGIDHNGAPVEESGAAVNSEYATTNYYASDVVITLPSGAAIASVDYDLSQLYEHKLKFESGISEGLTLEVQEGNSDTPITYQGLLATRGIFRLIPNDVGVMQLQVFANRVFPRQAMAGGSMGTSHANFGRLDFHGVPDFGFLWEIEQNPDGGHPVPKDMVGSYRLGQIALAADNRFAPPATAYADDVFYPKSVRKMNRELQSQLSVDYSKEANFDSFVGGINFPSLLSVISRPYAGPYRAIRIKYNNSQIVANPRRQVNGVGEIIQSIVMRTHIGSNPLGNDDTEITVFNTLSGPLAKSA